MNPTYAVVIPAHNEAGSLPALLREIGATMNPHSYEIVVVDDGSNDRTQNILRSSAADIPKLRVLRHATACGQSSALLSGVRAASAHLIITLDGDGQNNPADIPKLIAAWPGNSNQPILIIGNRKVRNDSWLRKFSSRIANGVRAGLLGDASPDSGCGLKLFRREDYLRLPYFDHMHRFLPALFIRHGGQVISVPIGHRARTEGVSKYGVHNRLWVGIVDLLGVWWLMRRTRIPELTEELDLKRTKT